MRYFIIPVCALLISLNTYAQDPGSRFKNAIKESSSSDLPILLIFSGSDWCKPCIKLREEILDSDHFNEFKKHLIILHCDFPYRKRNKPSVTIQKENELLADRYNPSGEFPKVILINQETEVLGEVPIKKDMTPEEFIHSIKEISKNRHVK